MLELSDKDIKTDTVTISQKLSTDMDNIKKTPISKIVILEMKITMF